MESHARRRRAPRPSADERRRCSRARVVRATMMELLVRRKTAMTRTGPARRGRALDKVWRIPEGVRAQRVSACPTRLSADSADESLDPPTHRGPRLEPLAVLSGIRTWDDGRETSHRPPILPLHSSICPPAASCGALGEPRRLTRARRSRCSVDLVSAIELSSWTSWPDRPPPSR